MAFKGYVQKSRREYKHMIVLLNIFRMYGWRRVGVDMGVYGEKIIWGQNVVSLEDYVELGFHSGQSSEP